MKDKLQFVGVWSVLLTLNCLCWYGFYLIVF
jgi:hypothetical protein